MSLHLSAAGEENQRCDAHGTVYQRERMYICCARLQCMGMALQGNAQGDVAPKTPTCTIIRLQVSVLFEEEDRVRELARGEAEDQIYSRCPAHDLETQVILLRSAKRFKVTISVTTALL